MKGPLALSDNGESETDRFADEGDSPIHENKSDSVTKNLLLSASTDAPESESSHTPEHELQKSRSLIYIFHTLNQFSELSWQFALILLWAAIVDYKSLFFVSTYGVCVQLSLCIISPWMGTKIDKAAEGSSNNSTVWTRLSLVGALIMGEGVMILVATICAMILVDAVNVKKGDPYASEDDNSALVPAGLFESREFVSVICIVLIHIAGSLAQVLDKACLTALERDWIVVMSSAASDTSAWLSETNVKLTQIDLGCQIIAPGFTGLLLEYVFQVSASSDHFDHWKYAILSLSCWNCGALCFEWRCLQQSYNNLTILQGRRSTQQDTNRCDNEDGRLLEDSVLISCRPLPNPCSVLDQLRVYFNQRSVAWGGLGLALLYCNALTFSGMMTAYLVSCGMTMDRIGILRGISSAVGLLGTIAYDLSTRRYSLLFTGLWSVMFEFLCLTLTFASIFFSGSISLALMIGGVLPSRIGKIIIYGAFMQACFVTYEVTTY